MSSYAPFNDARTLLLAAELLPTTSIAWANTPFSAPSDGSLWMSVDAYSPSVDLLDIGARVYQENGTIRIMLIAPVLSGTDELRQLAKAVTDVFRDLGPRNPYYTTATIGEGSTDENGAWFAMPVSIDFVYQSASV